MECYEVLRMCGRVILSKSIPESMSMITRGPSRVQERKLRRQTDREENELVGV